MFLRVLNNKVNLVGATLIIMAIFFGVHIQKAMAVDSCEVAQNMDLGYPCTNHFEIYENVCDTDPSNWVCDPAARKTECPNPNFSGYLCNQDSVSCNDDPTDPYNGKGHSPTCTGNTGGGGIGGIGGLSGSTDSSGNSSNSGSGTSGSDNSSGGNLANSNTDTSNSSGGTSNSSGNGSGTMGSWGGLVPCGNESDPQVAARSCDFGKFMQLINNVINALFLISVPLATIAFVYLGWMLLTAQGNAEKIREAKRIAKNVLIGFIFILSAWLIIFTITHVLVKDPSFNVFMQATSGTTPNQSGT